MMFCPSVLKLLAGSTTSASRCISSHAAKRKYPWIIPEMASFGAPGISKTPRIVHDSFLAGGFGTQPLNLLYQVRNSIIFLPFPPSPRKIPFVPPYVVSFWFLKCGRACDRSLLNRSPPSAVRRPASSPMSVHLGHMLIQGLTFDDCAPRLAHLTIPPPT